MLCVQKATIDSRQLGLDLSRRDYYPDFDGMGGYVERAKEIVRDKPSLLAG